MSWKKNILSYPVWLAYAMAVGIGLICLADAVCQAYGMTKYLGTGICVVYILIAGLVVFLTHRYGMKHVRAEKSHTVRSVVEAAVVVILLALGLVLRVKGMDYAGQEAAYYETASVMSGQGIPQIVHGAVYFYVQLLHTVFYFLGNKFTVAVWFQIIVQFGAVLTLYFSARHFVGNIAAMVMLGFCTLSPYMVQEAVTLSPRMLYLLFWSVALAWVVAGQKGKLKPASFLMTGVITAIMTYVDVAGILLLFLALAVIWSIRKVESGLGRKFLTLALCLVGMGAGFFGCVLLDAYLSKRGFGGVLSAWFQLYRPESFRLPVSLGEFSQPVEYLILFALLVLGAISFWRDKNKDDIKFWVLGLVILVAAECYGMFTREMPVSIYLYLLLTLLAGIGLEGCFRAIPAEVISANVQSENVEETVAETIPETVEEPPTESEPIVKLIENPLPLPKKHERRVLDFDYAVDDDDDFDI